MTRGLLLWDFDDTLAYRPGKWGGAMMDALDAWRAEHGIAREAVRDQLQSGFPWHAPEVAHPELNEPDAWWAHMHALLARAFVGAGCPPDAAGALAEDARARYLDPASYHLFDDTLAALADLRARGWRHAILSNHVPELPALVTALGLDEHIEATITSATTGFEKPHPEAYAHALAALGRPEAVWMIGDNPVADVSGAEAVGIPAILVRKELPGVARQAVTLHELGRWLD